MRNQIMLFDYKIDLISDIKLVAEARKQQLNNDQIEAIACKIFSNYSFNEWIEELIEKNQNE